MQLYAKDVMTESLITLKPEMTLRDAAEVLWLHHVSGAPVVDAEGLLLGVLSLHDILNAELENHAPDALFTQSRNEYHHKAKDEGAEFREETYVEDFLTANVITAFPDTPIEELAQVMYDNHIHRLVIVGHQQNVPVGIVSTFDLLKVIADSATSLK